MYQQDPNAQGQGQPDQLDFVKAFQAWRAQQEQAFQQSTGTAGALKLDPVNALNQAAGTSNELLPDGKVRGALIDKAVSMASGLATDIVGPSGSELSNEAYNKMTDKQKAEYDAKNRGVS